MHAGLIQMPAAVGIENAQVGGTTDAEITVGHVENRGWTAGDTRDRIGQGYLSLLRQFQGQR